MAMTRKSSRLRPVAALRTTLTAASAAAVLALTLTACNGDDAATASPTSANTPAKPAGKEAKPATPAPGTKPSTKPPTSGAGAKPTSPATTPHPAKPPAPSPVADADGCDHKMPISPDEIAVYRYTPEGGSLSLIIKYGNWGCAPKDSDGAPFVTVGKETYLPMDQAAYVTVTNPIVESTENQHIGVQELLDWLEAHPNSGLVFQYHLGDDGAIDRLEEVFTP